MNIAREEFANGVSHGVGLALAVVGAIALLISAASSGDGWRNAACSLYAATLVGMYAVSTLSHVFQSPRRREFFRILDQAMIFLLIAGTYTPFALAEGDDGWWLLFGAVWGVALTGFTCKILSGQERLGMGYVLTYFLLGWVPGVAMVPVLMEIPSGGVWWIVAGGLCYTIGAVFLALDTKIPYGHLTWHLFVIAGSGCHFFAILTYTESSW